ncbi:MAG TPA: flavodoxin family protein [Candidatus Acidoferrum sp.]|nr:flavodoxin family protein [Candidatus Acidoferrum sp.]
MKTVSIVYFSASGHTAKLAEAIGKGAASVAGVKTNLLAISGDDITKGRYKNEKVMAALDASDAIVFGSPTFMGGPAAQFKAFADASGECWYGQKWRDKIAAGFTVSGALSGDKLSTLQYFQTLAMQHGMVWIGLGELPGQSNGVNRLGSWVGAMAVGGLSATDETPSKEDLLTGEVLGKRVASFAVKIN